MFRLFPFVLGLFLLIPQVSNGDEAQVGSCTIVNTEDHPVVIGLYTPSTDGVSERLVSVPPRTELYDVPVAVTDDAQFVIAYAATMEGDKVRRASPIQICGHKRLSFLRDKHQMTHDAMIVYRGGYDPGRRDIMNNDALFFARLPNRGAGRASTSQPVEQDCADSADANRVYRRS